jgi:adenosine deaminase
MRPRTVLELAARDHVRLPDVLQDALRSGRPPALHATDARGWFRFQRLYDLARSVLRTPDDIRRLILEAAEDDVAEGSRWLELQVDPSGYAARFGGLTTFTELVLDAARTASSSTGLPLAIVVAANRTRHELDARTLARLAAQYAGAGVVGFGLSNDERRGPAEQFARAFAIARRAGLVAVPHAGELAGPASIRASLDTLGAGRLGHGVRVVEDGPLLDRVVEEQITLEVCPASNVALGVYPNLRSVPVLRLVQAGARLALGADDPLIFGSRLLAQYQVARALGLDDAALADLARGSISGSCAPPPLRADLLAEIDRWLDTRAGG